MDFGIKIIELRKEKKISQVELAKQLGIHKNVLGRYERNQAKPSIEVAAKIAALLNTSLDYLVGHTKADLDKNIADKILAVQLLPTEERERILFTIAALIRDAKSRFAYA